MRPTQALIGVVIVAEIEKKSATTRRVVLGFSDEFSKEAWSSINQNHPVLGIAIFLLVLWIGISANSAELPVVQRCSLIGRHGHGSHDALVGM